MSELNKIAELLQDAIAQRQTLTIGEASGATMAGQLGSFSTSTGMINAIATNFCTGNCLLAKVEGSWYATGRNDNRTVVRSSVDRFIERKPKRAESLPVVSIVVGTAPKDNGGGNEN